MLRLRSSWFLFRLGGDLPKIILVLGLICLIFRRAFLFKFVWPGCYVVFIVTQKSLGCQTHLID